MTASVLDSLEEVKAYINQRFVVGRTVSSPRERADWLKMRDLVQQLEDSLIAESLERQKFLAQVHAALEQRI